MYRSVSYISVYKSFKSILAKSDNVAKVGSDWRVEEWLVQIAFAKTVDDGSGNFCCWKLQNDSIAKSYSVSQV